MGTMNRKQAAAYFGVTLSAIDTWVKRHQLPVFGKNPIRFDVEALEAWGREYQRPFGDALKSLRGMLTLKQVARLAGCSTTTVAYSLRAGELSGIRTSFGWHVSRDAAEAWVRSYRASRGPRYGLIAKASARARAKARAKAKEAATGTTSSYTLTLNGDAAARLHALNLVGVDTASLVERTIAHMLADLTVSVSGK